ncbi:MAG: hypothetical protein E7296_07435 [Lachnospiraceae bacterium]|nr:hypothetical protein [Lachnospiraceae bacterium]
MLKMKKSLITMLVALVLVAAVGVGATLAYLSDKTGTVKNTFTIGKVDIDLTEYVDGEESAEGFDYTRVLPGARLSKNPVATVLKGSEDCYLFVKVVNPNTTITIESIAAGWTLLSDGVYYREVSYSATADQSFDVFNYVNVANTIDETATFEDIEITAYAVQKAGFADAAAAWTEASKVVPAPTQG